MGPCVNVLILVPSSWATHTEVLRSLGSQCLQLNFQMVQPRQSTYFTTLGWAMTSWTWRQMHRQHKKKVGNLDYIKMKTFYASKNTINIERQSTEWENILANHILTNGSWLEYTKSSRDATTMLPKTSDWKNGKSNVNGHFSQEDIQMASKHIKRCSAPLVIREMQTLLGVNPKVPKAGSWRDSCTLMFTTAKR